MFAGFLTLSNNCFCDVLCDDVIFNKQRLEVLTVERKMVLAICFRYGMAASLSK